MPGNDEGSTNSHGDGFVPDSSTEINSGESSGESSDASLAGRFIPPQTPYQHFYRHEDINESCSVDDDESGYMADSELSSDSESSYVAGYNTFWPEHSKLVNNVAQTAPRNKRVAKPRPPPTPLGTPAYPRFS